MFLGKIAKRSESDILKLSAFDVSDGTLKPRRTIGPESGEDLKLAGQKVFTKKRCRL